MAAFEYKGMDARGAAVAGIVDADSPKGARQKLRKQGVFPTDVWEQKAGKATRGQGLSVQIDFSRFLQRVRARDVAEMTSQLSTLVGAGIPMVESLSALIDQVENPALKVILVEVREQVNQGTTLADALRAHPRVFGDLYVNMVAAGEQSGALDIVLDRLTAYTEASVRLRSKLISSLTYPVLMGFVGFGIVVGLFVGVIPRVKKIFDSFDEGLPLITRVLLGISDLVVGWWWLMLILAGAGIWWLRRYVKTPEGRHRWHALALKMPIFGRINRLVAVSRFARTMATLLSSGVPILTALGIVKNVVQNDIIADAVSSAGQNIAEGQSIAVPLKASGQFPPLVTHMIAVGEKTGDLEPMLGKVADAYDQQVENILGTLTSLLEPIIIVFMGGVVLLVALAILLPMMQLSAIAR